MTQSASIVSPGDLAGMPGRLDRPNWIQSIELDEALDSDGESAGSSCRRLCRIRIRHSLFCLHCATGFANFCRNRRPGYGLISEFVRTIMRSSNGSRRVSLHSDLLKQAHRLARHEPRRPRQASLRRAVSTAYYALFHLLADAASREIVSGQNQTVLRSSIGRALNHTETKKACLAVANWNPRNPPPPLVTMIPQGPGNHVRNIGSAFVELQQARHEADYDLLRRFSRSDMLALLTLAGAAFASLASLNRTNPERRVFLLALVFHGRWRR